MTRHVAILVAALGLAVAGTVRADESGLRDRLAPAFARAHRVWPAPPDPFLGIETGPDQKWTRRRAVPATTGVEWHRASPVDSSGRWSWAEGEECSTSVYSRFVVDGDTLRTTLGRVQEGCNEIPRLEWRDRRGAWHRERLTPALDYNVESLWVTPSWLVLELTAQYEGAPPSARIAVWDLASGAWRATPHGDWSGSATRQDSAPRPADRLGRLSDVEVAERSGALFLRGGADTLVLWPGVRAWAASRH